MLKRWNTKDSGEKEVKTSEKPKENKKDLKKKQELNKVYDKYIGLKKKHNWFGIIFNILALPFRLVALVFKTIYMFLNLFLVLAVAGCFVGLLILGKVYPMYQEASSTAYEKLASIKDSNFRMLGNTVIYDKDGAIIGEINAGDYQYVDISDVSEYVQNGYIAIEDKRFKEHCGIDLKSLTRAGLSLIKHNGEITQGGSTITQQVIKNNVLSQEQTYSRKLTEVLIAPKIEQLYSKAKIMEFYVNSNYYGNGCYGIETASRYYFGKSAKDLKLAEAAMLCGVSNSPNKYNPVASMDLAKQKMKQVLDEMLAEEYISDKQYKKALKTKIKLSLQDESYDNDNYMISYAIYCATLQLMEQNGFEFKYTFNSSKEQSEYQKKYSETYTSTSGIIRGGGYSIYTSFDQKLQDKLQKTIDNGLKNYTETQDNGKYALQGSAVCVDNKTGFVVAMVGGRGEKDEFNRAFLAKRQPGSCIKPLLVYAPGINEGIISPSMIYTDKKVYAVEGKYDSYSPSNSGGGFRGDMPIREALARSINTIAFQVYRNTGSETAMSYLDKMKFSSMDYADNTAVALCLGGFTQGVRIVDMAKGYQTIASGGEYSDRDCITKIEHEVNGKVYESPVYGKTTTEVFNCDTAFMMQDIMQGTLEEPYGTGKSIKNSNMIAGGKTGTTSSNKDAWFCGFTKYYTTAVWVGYDTPKTMAGMYGGTVPAKIWSNFMTGIKKNMTKADFEKPETIVLRDFTNGNYGNEDIEVNYSKVERLYTERKQGTEWFSTINEKLLKQEKQRVELQRKINNATSKVEEFEKFYIKSVEDALNLDNKYQSLLVVIDSIGDVYKETKLRIRAAKHYEELSNDVKKNWEKYKKEYYEALEDEREATNKLYVEDSNNQAINNLKQTRLNKADWFINKLNSRKYYTDTAKLLIKDAKEAVDRLKGYSEYDSYLQRLNTAISVVEKLPTEPEKPEKPADDEDKKPVDENKYPDDEDEWLDEEEENTEDNESDDGDVAITGSNKKNNSNKNNKYNNTKDNVDENTELEE